MMSIPFSRDEQDRFMRIALEEGRKGLGATSPNPPVGAVIVDDEGQILGRGFHAKAGTAHAEVNAIRNARENHGSGATRGKNIFVTLEPCSTTGRTPPCCDAIIEAGIARVFIGSLDPNPKHAGAALSILENAGIIAIPGILETETDHLIRFFARHIQAGLPYVIAKTATTLDGHTTLTPERGQWISSPESREDVQNLRRQCDAILVGGATVRADNPRLTLRGEHAEGRPQPQRIVITQSNDLPKDSNLFTDEFSNRTRVFYNQSLGEVLEELGREGICSVLIESGGKLFSRAIEEGAIDEVVIYLAPILGGGETSLIPRAGILADLEEMKVDRFGPDLRITARVVKP